MNEFNKKMSSYVYFIFLFFANLFQTNSFDARNGINRLINLNLYSREYFQSKNNLENLILSSTEPTVKYREEFADINIDHFSMDSHNKFKLRYLINDDHFVKKINKSPILFYCGNESPIEDFWNNSGFLTLELAHQFKGIVIFAEHRFFGKSMINGNKQDYDLTKNKFLTVEQAMADFVELLAIIRIRYQLPDETHPTIAFGGSYGGMLAAWSRMKFPHIYAGAVASSAPILLFEDIDKISNSFFKIATETYRRYDTDCPSDIRNGFKTLRSLKSKTSRNFTSSVIFSELNEIFNICYPIKDSSEIDKLENTIEEALIALAQYNYPYESSFGIALPAYPVKVACENIARYKNSTRENLGLLDDFKFLSPLMKSSITFTFNKFNQISPDVKKNLNYLKQAISVYYNSTGTLSCLDIGNNVNTTESTLNGWSYLACSEMVMPMQTNGDTDMFNPHKWDLDKFTSECNSQWGVDVRPTWAFNFFGGKNFSKEIKSYSNILFINGNMDPWNAGCPHGESTSKVNIFESDSAHHLDLRYPNSKDPESIVEARKLAVKLITKWIISTESDN